MLAGRRVVLGVTGGIAAYKSVYLARRLVERGAQVRTVMSRGALRFVARQSFSAVTGRAVETELFGGATPIPHTDLARWADAVVVAPATAKLIAKLAHGLSDDLLSATLLTTTVPVLVAPAMHAEMWEHPATRRNVAQLQADGYRLVGPGRGQLAGGEEGPGRMAEPEEIVATLEDLLAGDLEGWRVLVTAGGTREPIDPVRYLSNRSSGKMGHALASEAARRGASVTLVTSAELAPPAGAELVEVETAAEMAEAVWSRLEGKDVVVMAAAVADFRPKAPSEEKLRRAAGPPELVLEPTPDILDGITGRDQRPYVVGFAAEAGAMEGALDKARHKRVDLLVANDVARPGSGFGTDTNQVTLILPDGRSEPWPLMAKAEVARRLWDRIAELRRPR
ncbi:MAG: bifunctional phosphopantothenoylcysteine decarboxylase/phosphopantothenate--cysteine ligase CoaBC [Actinomycetota bacterium]|nr:bifunctional phosphopantothenoylcysteine decarboxylase/phosphopantothenate--cysteine ligase CoaBC [Actinomycetota bacterium]